MRDWQLTKAPKPIEVTLAGRATERSERQSQKALRPIEVMPLGRAIEVSDWQL